MGLGEYVFGPSRGGVLFIHRRNCSRLDNPGAYRECPEEVVALVKITEPETGFVRPSHVVSLPTARNIGLCPHCIKKGKES